MRGLRKKKEITIYVLIIVIVLAFTVTVNILDNCMDVADSQKYYNNNGRNDLT